jgi:branched-chain amino acid transport system substrate-binding protein
VFSFGDGACTDKMKNWPVLHRKDWCARSGNSVQASSKAFLDAYKKSSIPIGDLRPFTYDATNLIIAAMQTANSADPAKYLPELAKIKHDGASSHIGIRREG